MSDIPRWLEQLGLAQYVGTFVENDIDERILADLTDADLKELGVRSLGHRKILLKAIAPPADRRGSNAIFTTPLSCTSSATRIRR